MSFNILISMKSVIPGFIKFHRDHIPIHENVFIRHQKDYGYHMAMLHYLKNQYNAGFKEGLLITMHYQHPTEHGWNLRETAKPLGHRDRYTFKTNRSIWNEVALYRHFEKHRNDLDLISQDARKVWNIMLKYLYGIKRVNQEWKDNFPHNLTFHEKGKVKLQYHTHWIIEKKGLLYDSPESVGDVLKYYIKEKAQCASLWKPVHVERIYDMEGMMSYLNKETNYNHTSLDPICSRPFIYQVQ